MFTIFVVLIYSCARFPLLTFYVILEAQKEMAQSDILVCGKCHSVFHFLDLFKDHKANNCKRISGFKDCVSISWAFLPFSLLFEVDGFFSIAWNETENMGLLAVEADTVPEPKGEWGEPVEALPAVDAAGGQHSPVMACCRRDNSVFWKSESTWCEHHSKW